MDETYTFTLRPEPDGGLTVHVPALPEIVTCGENEQEALAMAKDASELVLESRKDRGEEIPESDAVVAFPPPNVHPTPAIAQSSRRDPGVGSSRILDCPLKW